MPLLSMGVKERELVQISHNASLRMISSYQRPTMHLIDTLAAAGAERVAVNIVNHLPRDRYIPYLCTTRSDGPLDALVAPDVIRLRLQRRSRFDLRAVIRL